MNDGGAPGPVSPVPREARRYQGITAGLVTRLVAGAIDVAITAAILAVGYALVSALLFVVDPRGFSFPETSMFFGFAASFAAFVGYLTAGWSLTGRTYGCHVMGLRVVMRGGQRIRFPVALLRAVLYALLPVGLFWCAVSPTNRSLQDLALRTSVVYDWQPRAARPDQRADSGT